MRIFLMSDVHRGVNNTRWPFVHPDVDVIIVAGDIESPAFLRQQGKKYPDTKILAVLGNHDFYDREWGQPTIDWWKSEVAMRSNVQILEREEIIIQDVVFLGTTLWAAPKPQDHVLIQEDINDFHCIKILGKKLTLEPVIQEFEKNAAWLEAKLNEHAGKKVVVITHFVPADFCIHEKYKGNPTNGYYSVNFDLKFMQWPMPKLWVFGHMHMPCDIQTPTTRFVSNPYGYYFFETNKNFNHNLVLDV